MYTAHELKYIVLSQISYPRVAPVRECGQHGGSEKAIARAVAALDARAWVSTCCGYPGDIICIGRCTYWFCPPAMACTPAGA